MAIHAQIKRAGCGMCSPQHGGGPHTARDTRGVKHKSAAVLLLWRATAAGVGGRRDQVATWHAGPPSKDWDRRARVSNPPITPAVQPSTRSAAPRRAARARCGAAHGLRERSGRRGGLGSLPPLPPAASAAQRFCPSPLV